MYYVFACFQLCNIPYIQCQPLNPFLVKKRSLFPYINSFIPLNVILKYKNVQRNFNPGRTLKLIIP